MSGARVEVLRGGVVESIHTVDIAVAVDDELTSRAGDPGRVFFVRSAVKPFQAMPLVEDGVLERYGLGLEALALACASHSSEPRHVDVARGILEAIGLDETALECGPHLPYDEAAADALRRSGAEPGRIHNNCSGKHAAMLALARAHGWPTDGYHRLEHPVQRRMLKELERWTGVPESETRTAVDGCGIITAALPLDALATAFARLAAAAAAGETGPATVVEAMVTHPFLVAGTDRLCTGVMEATQGRIVAKVGAEGVYGAAVPADGLGIALKARDGAWRAGEVGLVGVLDALGLLSDNEREAVARWGRPPVKNTRNETVGEMRAVVELEAGSG